jgi:5-methylcytosine-specific restriction endonuclease McrA
MSKYQRYRLNHPDRVRESRKKYYRTHLKKERERSQRYAADHYKERSVHNKAWREANAEILRKKRLAQHRTLEGKFKLLRDSAKLRHYSCELTFEQYIKLISSGQCYYCGGSLPEAGHGLDRINPRKGYVIGNVRPCCRTCNVAKNSSTEKEFRKWLVRLTKHYLKSK